MAQTETGQDSRVLALAGVMLGILAISMNLLPLTGGPAAGITSETDPLACLISASPPNCLSEYCNTGNNMLATNTDNCNSTYDPSGFGLGYCPNGNIQINIPTIVPCTAPFTSPYQTSFSNSTKRVFSSSTYTTYVKVRSVDGLPAPFPTGSAHIYCHVDTLIQSSNVLAVLRIKIRDTVYNRDGPVWVLDTLVSNNNFTISYSAFSPNAITGTSLFASNNNVYEFQLSVSGTGTFTVYQSSLECFTIDVFGSIQVG